jgi:hypothetical protein
LLNKWRSISRVDVGKSRNEHDRTGHCKFKHEWLRVFYG